MSAAAHPDLPLALDAVRRAAAVVAGHFRTGLEVRYKSAEQPVTAADLEADAVLREALLGARPGYGWLSEESPALPAGERVWLVDPIDGTSSFVAGIPEFAVSVGLLEDGAPVLGVVANPATGELFSAVRGGGAFRGDARIHVSNGGRRALVVSRAEQARGWLAAFADWEQRPCGSTALKMCRVAEGAAEAFVSFGPKHAWDVCAADLIVREAGGRVGGLRGEPLDYAAPYRGWVGLAASTAPLHAEVLRTAALAPGSAGR